MAQAKVKSTAVSEIFLSFQTDTSFLYNVFIAVDERYNTLFVKKKPKTCDKSTNTNCLVIGVFFQHNTGL